MVERWTVFGSRCERAYPGRIDCRSPRVAISVAVVEQRVSMARRSRGGSRMERAPGPLRLGSSLVLARFRKRAAAAHRLPSCDGTTRFEREQNHLGKGRTCNGPRPLHVPVWVSHRYFRGSRNLETISTR